jgi:hypothetical protein
MLESKLKQEHDVAMKQSASMKKAKGALSKSRKDREELMGALKDRDAESKALQDKLETLTQYLVENEKLLKARVKRAAADRGAPEKSRRLEVEEAEITERVKELGTAVEDNLEKSSPPAEEIDDLDLGDLDVDDLEMDDLDVGELDLEGEAETLAEEFDAEEKAKSSEVEWGAKDAAPAPVKVEAPTEGPAKPEVPAEKDPDGELEDIDLDDLELGDLDIDDMDLDVDDLDLEDGSSHSEPAKDELLSELE